MDILDTAGVGITDTAGVQLRDTATATTTTPIYTVHLIKLMSA